MNAPNGPSPARAAASGTAHPNRLTTGQRALLESELRARMRELDRRLAHHHEGGSRVDHAHEMLEQDADDASQHAMDREVDLGLSDLEMRELDALGQALARIHEPDYGTCADCACEIPFDRLKVEPQALRCVACAARLETRQELMK